jgi:hypothetical protein
MLPAASVEGRYLDGVRPVWFAAMRDSPLFTRSPTGKRDGPVAEPPVPIVASPSVQPRLKIYCERFRRQNLRPDGLIPCLLEISLVPGIKLSSSKSSSSIERHFDVVESTNAFESRHA